LITVIKQTELAGGIKGVFFDLYGTLLILGDMKRAWSDWIEVLYVALCPPERAVTRETFDDCCHQFFSKEEPIVNIEDGMTVFERRIDRLAASLGSKIELALLKETAARAVTAWQAYVQVDPEGPVVLSALAQNWTLALISNFDHPPHAHRILRETGLATYFKTIVVSGEVGIKKPDPEIFRIALRRTGLQAEEVVYVGDAQEDVDGARAAGIKPILIARPEDPQRPRLLDYTRKDELVSDWTVAVDSISTVTIKSLSEIVKLIQNAGKTNVQ
jgi:HAD superfamily hydrolase (TIGR01549 family)